MTLAPGGKPLTVAVTSILMVPLEARCLPCKSRPLRPRSKKNRNTLFLCKAEVVCPQKGDGGESPVEKG